MNILDLLDDTGKNIKKKNLWDHIWELLKELINRILSVYT